MYGCTGKGGGVGGGGQRETGTKKNPTREGADKAVGHSKLSRNAEAIFPAKSLSYGTSRTIAGGAVFYAPPKPTPKPSTTNRIGR